MRTLTVNGKDISCFSIVLKTNPEPAEKRAAEFLARVIAASCGVSLPVTDRKTGPSILIGMLPENPEIKWDGFRICSDGDSVHLCGNLARGTLYAAYDFAERFLGYRYLAVDTEIIPTEGSFEIPASFDLIQNPGFEGRRTDCQPPISYPEVASHYRLNDCMHLDETYGGLSPNSGECHTFGRLCPPEKYWDTHPEYYSLWEGKRVKVGNDFSFDAQLCLSNPDVIRIATENALDWMRKHPDLKILEISQCDNPRYCTCENCARIDEEEGTHCGTIIRFVNAIAEAVEKEFPDVMVRTFAYIYSRQAPKITRARKNVLIRYCTIEACFRHALNDPSCKRNYGVFNTQLEEWGKMADQVSIWDYVCNYKCYITPFPNLIALWKNARMFADNNVIQVFEESTGSTFADGAYGDLKAYLIGRLLWNPYMTWEEYCAEIDTFLAGFYGPGWREIRDYIKMEHEVTADKKMRCFADVDVSETMHCDNKEIENFYYGEYIPKAYQPPLEDSFLSGLIERLDEAFSYWDKAWALAENDTQKMHIERSRTSLTYLKLFCTRHDKKTMTAEEKAAYEAEVNRFYEDKEKYGFHYNIHTSAAHRR
ncbi:MAG: DUF4838 domain-containing protein [Clostridia bacterium]|nr:DUF4838 domain-containing protein [Clostridia bacterium]